MIKFLSLFIVFISCNHVFAADNWDDLIGCYKTVAYNGVPVDVKHPYNSTTIKKGTALFTRNMDYSQMPGLEMMFFKAPGEDVAYMGYAIALDGVGKYYTENNSRFFYYKGQVRYAFQPETHGTLLHEIEIKNLPNGDLWVHNYLIIIETGDFNTNETYILRPVLCE